ncbi:MAG: anti-sigma factor [Alphaproteobacteria bacterium]
MNRKRIKKRDDEYWRRIAGEYVLGTLRGRARRRFERLRARDAYYCNMADEWESRFHPLADSLPETEPPPEVWTRISQRLDGAKAAAGPWNRLVFWRGFGLASAALAASLLVFVAVDRFAGPSISPPERVAVLTDKAKTASWLVTVTHDGRRMSVTVLRPLAVPKDRTLELWLIAKPGEGPRSLGLLPKTGRRSIELPREVAALWGRARRLAITLEPAGGWKPGTRLGPVLFSGPIGVLPR